MLYILDTNVVSALMNANPRVIAHLQALSSQDRAAICSTVRGEILFGIERMPLGRRREELYSKASRVFGILPCEPLPCDAANQYAVIKTELQRHGRGLEDNDLWIAATALSMDSILVTRDSDFRRIRGLTVEDWTQ